jgi:hypothetical protein
MKRIGAFYKFLVLTHPKGALILLFVPEECPALMTILCKCLMKIRICCYIILLPGRPVFAPPDTYGKNKVFTYLPRTHVQ